MKEQIEKALKSVSELASKSKSPDEALKYTQAILNAAHALATLDNLKTST